MPNWVMNEIKITGRVEDVDKFISDLGGEENFKFSFNTILPIPEELARVQSPCENDVIGLLLRRGEPLLPDLVGRLLNFAKFTIEQIKEKKIRELHLKGFADLVSLGASREDFTEAFRYCLTFGFVHMQPINVANAVLAYHCIKTYGCKDWYDWRLINYGCKWDCSDPSELLGVETINGTKSVSIFFDTPWDAPYAIVRHLVCKYGLRVDHKYSDECTSCGNNGIVIYTKMASRYIVPDAGTKESLEIAQNFWEYPMRKTENGYYELDYGDD